MTYGTEEFWNAYKKFANKSHARHKNAFTTLMGMPQDGCRVLDLGCGHALIGFSVLPPTASYCGIDLHLPDGAKVVPAGFQLKRFDYQSHEERNQLLQEWKPDIVTSWFSTDVVLSQDEARDLYWSIFSECPSVRSIFTVGFYYDDERRNDLMVQEAGDLTSYQVSRGKFLPRDRFYTTRLEIQAPSDLFGETVVEVFTRISRRA